MAELSIIIPTLNSEAHIPFIVDYYDSIGAEPYFFVDQKSSDRTFDVLATRSRRVIAMQNEASIVEAALEKMSHAVSTQWVLRIDDDELPSARLVKFAHDMADADCYDAVGFLRYQCGVSASGALMAQTGHDPHVHRQYRLYHRDRVKYRTDIHTAGFHFTGLRVKYAPPEYFLIHLDWAVRSYSDRKKKIETYNAVSPNAGEAWRSYYLHEDLPGKSAHVRLDSREFVKIAHDLSRRFPENTIRIS